MTYQMTKEEIKSLGFLQGMEKESTIVFFECMFTDVQFKKTKEQIAKLIDRDDDSVAYYPICVDCFTKAVYQPERRSNDRLVMVP